MKKLDLFIYDSTFANGRFIKKCKKLSDWLIYQSIKHGGQLFLLFNYINFICIVH